MADPEQDGLLSDVEGRFCSSTGDSQFQKTHIRFLFGKKKRGFLKFRTYSRKLWRNYIHIVLYVISINNSLFAVTQELLNMTSYSCVNFSAVVFRPFREHCVSSLFQCLNVLNV